ncbi:hypothetical protein FOZ63_000387, partial [Perkinsus olseni]
EDHCPLRVYMLLEKYGRMRMSCEAGTKSKSWMSFIAVNIVLIQMIIPVCVDALDMHGTVTNPLQDPELRSLRLPAVVQSPPDCLPPGKGFQGENHCWYVLKGPHQFNGGALFASNNSGYTGFATLEMAVMLASNSSPVDVGVWADGKTIWLFNLPAGISVVVELSIPTFSKTGGYNYLTGKRLDFPVFLKANATVPDAGAVRAGGNGTAVAFVDMRDGMRLIPSLTHSMSELLATVRAEGKAGLLSSRVILYAALRPYDATFERWAYSAYISCNISTGGNQSYFEVLRIFDGWV